MATGGETVRQLTLAGNNIACLSGFMANEDIVAGKLIPLSDQCPVLQIVFLGRRISAFIDLIQPRLSR